MRGHSALAKVAFLIGLIVPAAVPAAASAVCPDELTLSAQQSEAGMSQSIVCLINEQRAAAGIAPVLPSKQLAEAASAHSSDMVVRGYFGHTSPNGADFLDRIANTGYLRGGRGWIAGENIAWGTDSLSTPATLVQAWMESPPHRENLLRKRFRDIGIGIVRGTPEATSDFEGVTVTTEYGYLSPKKGHGSAKAVIARRLSRGF